MKAAKLIFCSLLASGCGFGLAGAAGNFDALDALTKDAQGLAAPVTAAPAAAAVPAQLPLADPSCPRNLSNGVIVAFSGGLPPELPSSLSRRFDEYIASVNSDPLVKKCSGGAGFAYKLLDGQKSAHLHQVKWAQACKAIKEQKAGGPVIIAGYSMGGGAAVSLARCLNAGGRPVDLLLTLDTVPTGDDEGDVYAVPPNVSFNVNLFQTPNAVTFLVPFPFGHANKREDGAAPENILNAGMHYHEPAAAAHVHLIYSFSGGSKTEDNAYSTPFALRDVTLAWAGGATSAGLKEKAIGLLRDISAVDKIKVTFPGIPNGDIPAPRE